MKLEDVPDLKGNRYPARISVSLSSEAKTKLDSIKKIKGKDTSELVRMLLDDFLKGVDFNEAV
jgi:metal-responsive CopG/Arc/MetJ family transcriptional regulator